MNSGPLPDHQVDIELSSGDNSGWKKPSGDDTKAEEHLQLSRLLPTQSVPAC
jgi:hypothetical protein